MRAYVLSIGSELVMGHLTDTNATYLAQQLAGLGVELLHVTQVGDDLPRLTATLRRAMDEADLVVCTGGVGPTADDLTREAIAAVFDETPVVQPDLLEGIRGFFRARGLEMPERNAKQAWLIPSAEALANPAGTAPGWFARRGKSVVVAMPGVPREMTVMWAEQVVPRLAHLLGGRAVRSRTIKTLGIGESAAEDVLGDLVAIDNPVVATYAKDDGVHIRVTAAAPDANAAEVLRDATVAEVQRRLAPHVYAADETTLAGALIALLRRRHSFLAVVDAAGGGRFAALLAADPAAEDVLLSATFIPRVDGPGAPELASAAAHAQGATTGLGILVRVEPRGNGVYEGTVDAAVAGDRDASEQMKIRAQFGQVHLRAALFAADLLRRALAAD